MKILFIADTYPPNVNGAALAVARLVQSLAKRKHHIYIIAPSTTFKSARVIEKNITTYRVKSVPVMLERTQKFRISPQPLHTKELRKIVDEIQPDIIHINEPWPMGLSALKIARKLSIPIVLGHHFMPENLVHFLHLPQKLEHTINRKIWQWYANECKKADLVISPTKNAQQILSTYAKGIHHEVISNGVDLKRFSSDNDGSYLQKKYKLPAKNIIVYVGRIDKEKNIDVLIKAIALCKKKIDIHTVIVGQGKEEKSLKELVRQLHVQQLITFTGYLPENDLPNIYKVADIFVMPSIAELQSLVTMEAMASGLPIIGAQAVALPHLIFNNENGFLFTPGNAKDLADKIYKILTNPKLREKMGEKSKEIIQTHDIEQVTNTFEQTYMKLIKRKTTSPQ
jgi:glycosyltransferase involved in cell wall biosynthesis